MWKLQQKDAVELKPERKMEGKKAKEAVKAGERDLQDVYEIDRTALALAALIETHHGKRAGFEAEAEARKESLKREIDETRGAWQKEKEAREAAVTERDQELASLRDQVAKFPGELEKTVQRAVKEATERILLETRMKEAMLKKGFEGEKNVFAARIESLEKQAKKQGERIARLTARTGAACQKFQDMAVKTVEGASSTRALSGLQQILGDQLKKQGPEKWGRSKEGRIRRGKLSL